MEHSQRLSPREEALQAIREVRRDVDREGLTEEGWEELLALAWDHRSHAGDRGEIRRKIRDIIVKDLRNSGAL